MARKNAAFASIRYNPNPSRYELYIAEILMATEDQYIPGTSSSSVTKWTWASMNRVATKINKKVKKIRLGQTNTEVLKGSYVAPGFDISSREG